TALPWSEMSRNGNTAEVPERVTIKPPPTLTHLIERYDPQVFEVGRPSALIRLAGAGPEPSDVVLEGRTARLVSADAERRPDATLSADAETWSQIAADVRGGMEA